MQYMRGTYSEFFSERVLSPYIPKIRSKYLSCITHYIVISASDISGTTGIDANSGFLFVGSYRKDVHFAVSDMMPRLLQATSSKPKDIPNLQYEQLG